MTLQVAAGLLAVLLLVAPTDWAARWYSVAQLSSGTGASLLMINSPPCEKLCVILSFSKPAL